MNGKNQKSEKELWNDVIQMFPDESITLGTHWSYNLRNDPKRLAFVLSRYKFAAKMTPKGSKILELGCSEGIGTPILAEFANCYTGIDLDEQAVDFASKNWSKGTVRFIFDDFLGKKYGQYDSIVSLDVIEHIVKDYEYLFFSTIFQNLSENGICIIGTPNVTSAIYASPASQSGHVNLFDGERLCNSMKCIFETVFLFGGNDEVVHTGFTPMTHYLFALGCGKKEHFSYVAL